ncbi:MAG: type I restriction enzyme HsdR N-terminal domain-containing protein [Chitinophagaceae bacterium]|nr:type I restriction enzyme HsdR N-terminal domain-containing protein [Oligoflexus sp.]
MSRETKTDRLVRTISENVLEHIHELKTLVANPGVKELDVERFIQSFMRACLGFSASNGYAIRPQEIKGRHRPDLIVQKNDKPVLVCEIKKLGFDLQKSEFRSGKVQLKEYLNQFENVRWGILSNGYELLLFDFQDQTKNGIQVLSFDFRSYSEQNIETTKKIVEEMCYDLADFHESSFSTKAWEEFAIEATAFSPESLAKAILSHDCVRSIARIIRGEHDYKADTEVLSDHIQNLIVNGLDDIVRDWNEVKQAELSKFIKSQKRVGRKVRQARIKGEVEAIIQSQLGETVAEVEQQKTPVPESA